MTISRTRRRHQSPLPWEPWDYAPLLKPPRRRRLRRPAAAQLVSLAKGGVEVVVADDSIIYRPLPEAPPSPDGDHGSELDAWIAKHHAR
jgi:hypothetical protein